MFCPYLVFKSLLVTFGKLLKFYFLWFMLIDQRKWGPLHSWNQPDVKWEFTHIYWIISWWIEELIFTPLTKFTNDQKYTNILCSNKWHKITTKHNIQQCHVITNDPIIYIAFSHLVCISYMFPHYIQQFRNDILDLFTHNFSLGLLNRGIVKALFFPRCCYHGHSHDNNKPFQILNTFHQSI